MQLLPCVKLSIWESDAQTVGLSQQQFRFIFSDRQPFFCPLAAIKAVFFEASRASQLGRVLWSPVRSTWRRELRPYRCVAPRQSVDERYPPRRTTGPTRARRVAYRGFAPRAGPARGPPDRKLGRSALTSAFTQETIQPSGELAANQCSACGQHDAEHHRDEPETIITFDRIA
jgi:hypothetical protein